MIADIGMGYAIVVAALIAACGSVLTTWLQVRTRRDLRPPSGGTIGEAVERTHHLAAVNTAGLKALVEHTEGVDWRRDVDGEDEVEPEAVVDS